MKHYFINLERREDKRNFWLGWNMAKGLPAADTTCFPGIDASVYGSLESLSEFAVDQGLDAYREMDPDALGDDTLGRVALRITHDLLLKQIAESGSTERTCIWNDDEVLLVEYFVFREFVENLETGIDVVGVPTDPYASIEGGKVRWKTKGKRRHATLPLYQGCVGSGYNQCMIVNAEGAAKLLGVGSRVPGKSYLELAFTHLEDKPWEWQSALFNRGRLTAWTDYFASDIEPGRPYDANMGQW